MFSKKFGQLKQWTGEKIGSSSKTEPTDEYKKFESTTEICKDDLESLINALEKYLTTFEKKQLNFLDIQTKQLPLEAMANTMTKHGRFLGEKSYFGQALTEAGLTESKIATYQTEFMLSAKTGFLSQLQNTFESMKDYQNKKKKLHSRRLDYDARLNKSQKKKDKAEEDEELRASHTKYEETFEQMMALMRSFGEKEEMLVTELKDFVVAQHQMFIVCEEEMRKLREDVERIESVARTEGGITRATPGDMPLRSKSMDIGMATQAREIDGGRRQVTAMYDFEGQAADELTFAKGDTITVVRRVNSDWLVGEYNGVTGMFPANYVLERGEKCESPDVSLLNLADDRVSTDTIGGFEAPKMGVSMNSVHIPRE